MTTLPPPVDHVALPLAPLRLTRNEAEARTLLAQHVRRRAVSLGETAWQFSMEPLARGATLAFGDGDWRVRAEWGGAPLEVRLPASAADQILRARFASLELPQLPAPIRTAAFESALHDALAALETAGHGPVRIDNIEEAAGPATAPSFGHHFGLTLAHGEVTLWATLSADALGLMLMAGLAAQWAAALGPLAHADVPVILRTEIGTATLSRAQLESLDPGDAILLQEYWIDEESQLWLGHRGWGLRASAEGSQLIVTEPFQLTERSMNDEFDEPDDTGESLLDEEPVALDALPVRLHFDLGQRTMPLAEVSELQVGQVIDLGRPLSQAVSIRANGTLVGTGELMEIGGRIAVGITSLGRVRGAAE